MPTGFIAFAVDPPEVAQIIATAKIHLDRLIGKDSFVTWRQNDIAGRPITQPIHQRIAEKDCLVADITTINSNVIYEIGFAIGMRKRVILVMFGPRQTRKSLLPKIGIFDTLGYVCYDNSEELAQIIAAVTDLNPIDFSDEISTRAPVFLIETVSDTDFARHFVARIKKSGLFYRSFDPAEQPRLSAHDAIRQVAQSLGVAAVLLPTEYSESAIHNARCIFVAGLAMGMGKELLLLQQGHDPSPLDVRDVVKPFTELSHIRNAVREFAQTLAPLLQAPQATAPQKSTNPLASLRLGDSTAENEFRSLSEYYVDTDMFNRVFRGEVRLVVGRKGSGKTALFGQVRDRLRVNSSNVVVDLKPEGFQLEKLKNKIVKYLESGTKVHTITAFWEYILLLELAYKMLDKDRKRYLRDHTIYDRFLNLQDVIGKNYYIQEGDFSERLMRIVEDISIRFLEQHEVGVEGEKFLETSEITRFLHSHNIKELRDSVVAYLKLKDRAAILFDNIDKGWSVEGLEKNDVIIVRSLIDACRKLQNDLNADDIDLFTTIFLRRDVYEMLIEDTADRGKLTKVSTDISDDDLLREILRRRFVYSGGGVSFDFHAIWNSYFDRFVEGEDSLQFVIERSLKRPRNLIRIIEHCKSVAINRQHTQVSRDDLLEGLALYSTDVCEEIGYEMRDTTAAVVDILYIFIGCHHDISKSQIEGLMNENGFMDVSVDRLIYILLWYGVLGVNRSGEGATYIFDVHYDMKKLDALSRPSRPDAPVFRLNPAFWPHLEAG